jgi:hypothetical protein
VDRSGWDEQDVAGLERHRRLARNLILHQAFEDMDDLFARMRVLGETTPGSMSMRAWTISRPGTLRSCRWRSVRLIPGCCARAEPRMVSAASPTIAIVLAKKSFFLFHLYNS